MHAPPRAIRRSVVVLTCLLFGTSSAADGGWIRPAAYCHPSPVHREAAPGSSLSVPYVRARGAQIHGFLFYFGIAELASETEAVLYTKGQAPGGAATKILWTVPAIGEAQPLQIVGKRRFGPGRFSMRIGPALGTPPIAGTVQYPSIVHVPQPGCWRVTLRSGSLLGQLEFRVKAAAR
jgi:hypothetical protein